MSIDKIKCCISGFLKPIIPTIYDGSYKTLDELVAACVGIVCKSTETINQIIDEINSLENKVDNLYDIVEDQVKTILQEWLADGTLSEIMANVVTIAKPENYGAKGDGVTDDTEAIQNCINDNPCGIVVFKGGVYCISDTITLEGNQSGVTLDFGSAQIKWIGATDQSKSMIHVVQTQNSIETRALITGGTFNGNCKCGIGLWADAFHTTLENFKTIDFTAEHVRVGQNPQKRSLQAVVKNGLVLMSKAGTLPWSESGNIIGISVLEPDNLFDNINVNRANCSVYIKTIGNSFVNCHFTRQSRNTPLDTLTDSYAVKIDPYSTMAIGTNIFTNCYFDNHKYVFYGEKSNRYVVTVSNSYYFWSGNEVENSIVQCFMCGGNIVCMDVNNFTVVPAGENLQFFDATFCPDINLQYTQLLRQQYNKTIYSISDAAKEIPYTAAHLAQPGEWIQVFRNNNVPLNNYMVIGSIVFNGYLANLDRCSPINFHYKNRAYGDVDFTVRLSPSSGIVLEDIHYNMGSKSIKFVISNPVQISLNGTNKCVSTIYLTGVNTALPSGFIFMSCNYNSPVTVYLVNDSALIKTSIPRNCLEIPMAGIQPVGSTFLSISALGKSTSDSLLSICRSLPNGYTLKTGLTGGSSTLNKDMPIPFQRGMLEVRKDLGTDFCEISFISVNNSVTSYFKRLSNTELTTFFDWFRVASQG